MSDLRPKPVETLPSPVETSGVESLPVVESPDRASETPPESGTEQDMFSDLDPAGNEPAPFSAPISATPVSIKKDPVLGKIEDVLSADLTDVFLGMSPDKQAEFKRTGEETAGKIRVMLEGAKVNAKKIFSLIREWLKLIPGVNRFFLEQEAKIRTDKILKLKP